MVEIDPLLRELAERYFAFQQEARLVAHVDDGRAFLERSSGVMSTQSWHRNASAEGVFVPEIIRHTRAA